MGQHDLSYRLFFSHALMGEAWIEHVELDVEPELHRAFVGRLLGAWGGRKPSAEVVETSQVLNDIPADTRGPRDVSEGAIASERAMPTGALCGLFSNASPRPRSPAACGRPSVRAVGLPCGDVPRSPGLPNRYRSGPGTSLPPPPNGNLGAQSLDLPLKP